MPIYEYCCSSCGQNFERLTPVSQADKATSCPKCQGPATRRMSRFASFSRSASGESAPIAGAGGGCSGCASSSCATCGH